MKSNTFSQKLLGAILVANAAVLPICGMQSMYSFYEWSKDTVKKCPRTSILVGLGVVGGYLWYQHKQSQTLMKQRGTLGYAVRTGDAQGVFNLLKDKSLVNLICTEDRRAWGKPYTLLHEVCSIKNDSINDVTKDSLVRIAEMLVDAGLSMEDVGCSGTPLMCAAYGSNAEVVRALVKKGANIKAQDARDCTVLHSVVEGYWHSGPQSMRDSEVIIDFLLDKGAEKDVRACIVVLGDYKNVTPAEYAQARAEEYEKRKDANLYLQQIGALKKLAEKLAVKK